MCRAVGFGGYETDWSGTISLFRIAKYSDTLRLFGSESISVYGFFGCDVFESSYLIGLLWWGKHEIVVWKATKQGGGIYILMSEVRGGHEEGNDTV